MSVIQQSQMQLDHKAHKARNMYLRWEIQLFTNSKMENLTLHQSRGKVGKYNLTTLQETLTSGKEPELILVYPYIHYFWWLQDSSTQGREEKEWIFHKGGVPQHAWRWCHLPPWHLQSAQTQPSPTLAKNNFAFWGPLPAGTGDLFSYLTSLFCSLWWGLAAHTVILGMNCFQLWLWACWSVLPLRAATGFQP